jgi:hypothetical protein
MTKKGQGEDPVARLQEAARWSSYINSWLRFRAPGRPPRWVRRIIIAAFVVLAVVGLVVGLIGLLTTTGERCGPSDLRLLGGR